MKEFWDYTWTLRSLDNWETYTWSVKAFAEWKQRLFWEYQKQYGRKFKEDFPTKASREAVYKRLLWFSSVDVFWTGRNIYDVAITQEVYDNAQKVAHIIGLR